jgi:hypothetical protein
VVEWLRNGIVLLSCRGFWWSSGYGMVLSYYLVGGFGGRVVKEWYCLIIL